MKEAARAKLISRNLKDLTADYPHVAEAAGSVTGRPFILDGEIVALDERGLPSFQALHHRFSKNGVVVYYAFNLLRLGDKDYRSSSLADRRHVLHQLKFAPPILLSEPLVGTPEHIESVVRGAWLATSDVSGVAVFHVAAGS